MKIARSLLVFLLVPLMLAPGSAYADQQHVINPDQLHAVTADRAAAQDADRAAVRDALARPEVRDAAAKLGVDINRLNNAVGTLSGADLERAAATARQVNTSLVGGASTVTISTTTIIIVLLIIILIVVIAN